MAEPTKLDKAMKDFIESKGWGGNVSDADCNTAGEGQ